MSLVRDDEGVHGIQVRYQGKTRVLHSKAVVLAAESAVREIVGRSKVDSVLYEQRDAVAADNSQLIASLATHWARIRKQLCASSSSA